MWIYVMIALCGSSVAVFRYHYRPSGDVAQRRRHLQFLAGFIVGQGLLASFLLAQTDLILKPVHKVEAFVTFSLFFLFIALLVSIFDD